MCGSTVHERKKRLILCAASSSIWMKVFSPRSSFAPAAVADLNIQLFYLVWNQPLIEEIIDFICPDQWNQRPL